MRKENITTIEHVEMYERIKSIMLKTILFYFLIIVTVILSAFLIFFEDCGYTKIGLASIIATIFFCFRKMVMHFFK